MLAPKDPPLCSLWPPPLPSPPLPAIPQNEPRLSSQGWGEANLLDGDCPPAADGVSLALRGLLLPLDVRAFPGLEEKKTGGG